MNSNEDPSAFGYESYVRQNDTTSQAIAENIAEELDESGWEYNRWYLNLSKNILYMLSDEQTIPSLLFEDWLYEQLSGMH